MNPFIFGRGDWRDIANLRATFSEGSVTVTRDYKDGHYEELDTQNTSETHEDALEGRLSKNRYRNTSDLSNEVQRANASDNFPPTKFEAARSRFFVERDGVSHPRNAEMRFSFRRSPPN